MNYGVHKRNKKGKTGNTPQRGLKRQRGVFFYAEHMEKEENIAWMSESFIEIDKIFPMFRLSIDGLKEGMQKLLGK